MKTQSKFYEKRTLDRFTAKEARAVLTFLAVADQDKWNADDNRRICHLSVAGNTIDAQWLYARFADYQAGVPNNELPTWACLLDDATNNAMLRVTTVDCLDAALKFLVKYGFLVDTSKTRWVVRKPFTPDDVDEACEVARLCGAPRLDHESAFDTLRRVREGQQPQSQQ